jgi:hypothetical protein
VQVTLVLGTWVTVHGKEECLARGGQESSPVTERTIDRYPQYEWIVRHAAGTQLTERSRNPLRTPSASARASGGLLFGARKLTQSRGDCKASASGADNVAKEVRIPLRVRSVSCASIRPLFDSISSCGAISIDSGARLAA